MSEKETLIAPTRTLDDYRKHPKRRGGGCAVCGQPVVARVSVSLQAREKVEGRGPQHANAYRYPSIDATSASYCEQHAIEVYEGCRTHFPPDQSGRRHGA